MQPASQTYYNTRLLKITEDNNLRKLLADCPNYREPRRINFRKSYFEIDLTFKACIENMFTKNKLKTSIRTPWRESVLTMVTERIKKLKQKIQLKQIKPVLCDPDVKSYLEALHKRFVVVIIYKGGNYFAFIYKKILHL